MINRLILFFLILATSKSYPTLKQRAIGSRIVGGKDAVAGQFRFATAINVQTSNAKFFCGGALVGYQWILTAGHCVDGAVLFIVTLGSHLINDEDNPNTLTLATSEFYLYPDYNPQTLEHDIGLIELRMPIQWTPYIEAIYLPFKTLVDNQAITALGWGQKSDGEGEISEHLQFISVTTLSNVECRMTYGNQIGDGVVCIAGNYNEGTCVGDSGSPLIEYNNNSYTTWHAGVSSFLSGNGCESTDPSGFTRSQYYITWLRTIIK